MNDPMKVDNAEAKLRWMAHDFFTPQTVVPDVYLYLLVLHNHPDEKAVGILKAAIPALKPGARILINNLCLPDPGEGRWLHAKFQRFVHLTKYYRSSAKFACRDADIGVRRRHHRQTMRRLIINIDAGSLEWA
jgi:hypothetical protein